MATSKLYNSIGKQLYTNPESIKRAQGRRKDRIYGKGLLKYNQSIAIYKKEPMRGLTV